MNDVRRTEGWWPIADIGDGCPGSAGVPPAYSMSGRDARAPRRKAPSRLVRRICGQRLNSVRSSFLLMTDLRFRLTEPKRQGSERSA